VSPGEWSQTGTAQQSDRKVEGALSGLGYPAERSLSLGMGIRKKGNGTCHWTWTNAAQRESSTDAGPGARVRRLEPEAPPRHAGRSLGGQMNMHHPGWGGVLRNRLLFECLSVSAYASPPPLRSLKLAGRGTQGEDTYLKPLLKGLACSKLVSFISSLVHAPGGDGCVKS